MTDWDQPDGWTLMLVEVARLRLDLDDLEQAIRQRDRRGIRRACMSAEDMIVNVRSHYQDIPSSGGHYPGGERGDYLRIEIQRCRRVLEELLEEAASLR